ncbi:hypothetical protein [Alteraurantiacibacter buctensis]|uniref:Uncharacterized protein n=1 Tax=Alteraurantiacibacter buctensis TaxID=1503981 RepID=A0A844YXH7_9SPHN|nr:hypothetical protein [Alteraurantiacibacter buctensis]MXO71872.1 hypothetical protein [Alteraurantiacibacter buctensis]
MASGKFPQGHRFGELAVQLASELDFDALNDQVRKLLESLPLTGGETGTEKSPNYCPVDRRPFGDHAPGA